MIPPYDFEPVTVSNGDIFVVQPPAGKATSIELLRRRGSAVVERLSWPYPSAGLGGGGLTVSASEKLLLYTYFSGQSEEAYRLISIESGMRELCACDYSFGEAASYAFSPDEALLVMALPTTSSEWWMVWDDDELERDDRGRRYIDFGLVRIQATRGPSFSQHALHVYPPDGWEPNRDEHDPDLRPTVENGGRIALSMPWGPLVLTPPLPKVVTVEL